MKKSALFTGLPASSEISRGLTFFVFLLAFAVFSAVAPAAYAATYTVTSTADSGSGTLREAMTTALGTVAPDTITFNVSGTITLLSALPSISAAGGPLTIDGTGQSVTVNGGGIVQVFHLNAGGQLNLLNLTITNGHLASNDGGGIYNDQGALAIINCTFSGNYTEGYGGGVYNNHGTVVITNSTFAGNTAVYGGGAILNNSSSAVTIANSTFSGNSNSGSYPYEGGAINNSGTMIIVNSTFSGNTAASNGGAIINYSSLSVTNSTFSGNSATGSGGAINNGAGTAALANTIVANSTSGGNCSGTITNGGNNIDDGATCGWGSTDGSMSGTPPLLGPLADNGGPTQTMALLAGSPAIDGVTFNAPNFAPPTDQRGITRPQGPAYDIGAFELRPSSAVAVPALNEWGLMIFVILAGLASFSFLRRRKSLV
jgi:predicted outer membrane repeat protein